ncbi:hypothetical protein AAVH_14020 [Aphelenchoides avenae]|nr:hypothetical protein AAVH_14020 [Aphelenchus avenae]
MRMYQNHARFIVLHRIVMSDHVENPSLPALTAAEEELLAEPCANAKPEEVPKRPPVLPPPENEVEMDDGELEEADEEQEEQSPPPEEGSEDSEDDSEARERHGEQPLTDEEANRRWRRNRPYKYPKEGTGPDLDTRRSLTDLLEELAKDLGREIEWLLGHAEGRKMLNEYVRGLEIYCPEMRSWLKVQWIAPQTAINYFITSPSKPPFNRTRLCLAAIYDYKRMPLEWAKDNLAYTGKYTGSWPCERLFCEAFAVLEKGDGKHERSWKSNQKKDSEPKPGPSTEQKPKRPRVNCGECGMPMLCGKCD